MLSSSLPVSDLTYNTLILNHSFGTPCNMQTSHPRRESCENLISRENVEVEFTASTLSLTVSVHQCHPDCKVILEPFSTQSDYRGAIHFIHFLAEKR